MAEAQLMGEDWTYNEYYHVHLSLNLMSRIICAETLQDIPLHEYYSRVGAYFRGLSDEED